MDIKDLTGFGEPLKKLIEVVSSGFGKMYEARATKKNAEAKAIEIRKITSALSESGLALEQISYKDGNLVINTINDNSNMAERAIDRLISQEEKRQANIENIVNNAANELEETEVISNEKVDEDWISRFFSIAEDVTSEEMQFIWGKILAGEIKKPRSFSLRTLEVVKNLSKDDAELITRFCKLGFLDEKDVFIIGDINF